MEMKQVKENVVHPRKTRFTKQSVSMVTLANYLPKRIKSSETLSGIDDVERNISKTPVTDVKLEPIKCKREETVRKGILIKNPTENIKNRLSSASSRSKESIESSSLNNEKDHNSGSETSLDIGYNSTGSNEMNKGSDSTCNLENFESPEIIEEDILLGSATNLELTKNLEEAIQKATDNGNNNFEKLEEECSDIMSNMRNCNVRFDAQKESLQIAKDDTTALIHTFKQTQKVEANLKSSFLNIEGNNMDFINEILTEELKFQMANKPTDKNGNMKEPTVNMEEKKKLLATLKAIDNGDSVDSIGNSPPHRQTNLMKQIFGDVSK